jgi:hypothetical protein
MGEPGQAFLTTDFTDSIRIKAPDQNSGPILHPCYP